MQGYQQRQHKSVFVTQEWQQYDDVTMQPQ
jgi:hypothetical protein